MRLYKRLAWFGLLAGATGVLALPPEPAPFDIALMRRKADASEQILASGISVVGAQARTEAATRNTRLPQLSFKSTQAGTGFGRSIALAGNGKTVLVGADNGEAYLFVQTATGWSHAQTLSKPEGLRCKKDGPYFGFSVALSNDGKTALVGASGIVTIYSDLVPIDFKYSCRDAAIYVKKGTLWVLEKLISAPGVTNEDLFGSAVALSGDGATAVVGAQFTPCANHTEECGAAYVFERLDNGWSARKSFKGTQSYDARKGFFGSTLALSADGAWALVGARAGETVWMLGRRGGIWQQLQKITRPQNNGFGSGLALSSAGERALIGAYLAIDDCDGPFNRCGAVYSYARQGFRWSLETSFRPNHSDSSNDFGEAVALSADGQRAAVGASGADCANGNCGAVYLFERAGAAWMQRGLITSPTAGSGGSMLGGDFGGAVALSSQGTRLLVGALSEDCDDGVNCGVAYLYAPVFR